MVHDELLFPLTCQDEKETGEETPKDEEEEEEEEEES